MNKWTFLNTEAHGDLRDDVVELNVKGSTGQKSSLFTAVCSWAASHAARPPLWRGSRKFELIKPQIMLPFLASRTSHVAVISQDVLVGSKDPCPPILIGPGHRYPRSHGNWTWRVRDSRSLISAELKKPLGREAKHPQESTKSPVAMTLQVLKSSNVTAVSFRKKACSFCLCWLRHLRWKLARINWCCCQLLPGI